MQWLHENEEASREFMYGAFNRDENNEENAEVYSGISLSYD